jgi:hypothetical protein
VASVGAAAQVRFGSSLVLVDSEVTSNEAYGQIGGGGVHIWDANTLPSGVFEAIDCDFGSGATENLPDDVFSDRSDNSYGAYGAGSSMVCTDQLCL